MSKLNPFSYLPSRSTTMRSLLYPVHLIVKFGIILYDNELPGRQRNVGVHSCEGAEGIPRSSITDPAVLNTVRADAPEFIAPKHVASVAVGEEVTSRHHVLSRRCVACGKYINHERKTLVGPSTQDLATGSSGDSPIWETQIGKKSTAEASTQTDEGIVVDDGSNDSRSSPFTLIDTPTDHASAVGSEDNERQEETVDEFQETVEDVGSTTLAEEALSTEMVAHQETREELARLKEQITTKDTHIQTSNANYQRLQRQSEQLEEERNNLREQLDEANSRIMNLEESADGEHVRRLESQVEDLEGANTRMWGRINDQHNIIRVGSKDLSSYTRVGTKLHARLNQVDRTLKGSRGTSRSIRAELGSADRLMRLATKWFPMAVPVKKHLREIQLAIEGPPADFYSSERISSDTPESTLMGSAFTFTLGMPAQETRQETANTAKKPIFKFGVTPTQDSRPKAERRAKETAIQFPATSAQENLRDEPSGVTASAQVFTFPKQTARPDLQAINDKSKARTEWVEVEEQTEGPTKKSRTISLHEAATSVADSFPSSSGTKAENVNKKTNKTTIFDDAASVNLSPLSPGNNSALGVSIAHNHERASETPGKIYTPKFNFSESAAKGEESASRTVTPPAFGVAAPTQFDFSPSGVMPNFGGINSNPAGASTALSDSNAVVVGGEDKQNQEPTGAIISRTSREGPSTPEGRVEGEAPSVPGKLGFDTAALTRIVNSVPPAVPEKIGVVDFLEGLVSQGAKPVNQAEDDKIDPRTWRSSGMTIAEVTARWKIEYRERAEPPAALMLWREPERPAALPPPRDAEPERSEELPPLALHQPPASSRAPRSSLVAFEEGIRYVMDAIEGLHIGPAAPPAILQEVDAETYFLSGDWVARPVLSQPEVEEVASTTSVGEAQEATGSREQERSVEPEVVVESEPRETDLATPSNGPQERPQMGPQSASQPVPQPGLQIDDTANSETQAPEPFAETGRESQELTKDTTPNKPSGGFRIWSLKKKR